MRTILFFKTYPYDEIFYEHYYDDDVMHICNEEDGVSWEREVSFIQNMNVLEDALEQVVPEDLDNIRKAYKGNPDSKKTWKDPRGGYIQSVKKLLQKNWDAVYAIVADDLK